MGNQSLLPALIATLTTIGLFIVKDWLFVARQRKIYAKRLLIHCCRTLLRLLEMNPASVDYLKATDVGSYIDIYLRYPNLDEALTCYLNNYFSWKNGTYMSTTEAIIDDAKRDLLAAIDQIGDG